MIDIHTHILPAMDDGARHRAVSEELLRAEWEQGVTDVVFTPHFYGRQRSPEVFLQQRAAAFERVKKFIPEGMNVRLGAEIHFTGINVPNEDVIASLAIEGTKYVLMELPFTTKWTKNLFERLALLKHDSDLTPIIAHVERYREIGKDLKLLFELKEMGCLLQVNTGAFLDKKTKRLAVALLKHGYVDCLGTDAHNNTDRSIDYAAAKAAATAKGLGEEWNAAQDTMRRILQGEQVKIRAVKPLRKIFGIYF